MLRPAGAGGGVATNVSDLWPMLSMAGDKRPCYGNVVGIKVTLCRLT